MVYKSQSSKGSPTGTSLIITGIDGWVKDDAMAARAVSCEAKTNVMNFHVCACEWINIEPTKALYNKMVEFARVTYQVWCQDQSSTDVLTRHEEFVALCSRMYHYTIQETRELLYSQNWFKH